MLFTVLLIIFFYAIPLVMGLALTAIMARQEWSKGHLTLGDCLTLAGTFVGAFIPLVNLAEAVVAGFYFHEAYDVFSRKVVVNRKWEQEQAINRLRGDT
jgi:hypothetical protein